jgi:ParB family transcriptional regulator, chromosome partitioning protein
VTASKHFAHIGQLHPHPDNIRDELGDISELADSIKVHGILQPVVVEHHPDKPGHYQIIAGHRRFAAAKRARLDMVPIAFRQQPADAPAAEPEELMLVENCQRSDLNPMDKAEAMGKLRRKGYTNVRIARSIGMSDATVGYYLSLLDLDVKSQEAVRHGSLAASDAVGAVRRTRAKTRKKEGRPAVGPVWEPDHFTSQHPLARKARAMCEAREHSCRRRIGKLACGECWETVIRADERAVAETLAQIGGRELRPVPGRREAS